MKPGTLKELTLENLMVVQSGKTSSPEILGYFEGSLVTRTSVNDVLNMLSGKKKMYPKMDAFSEISSTAEISIEDAIIKLTKLAKEKYTWYHVRVLNEKERLIEEGVLTLDTKTHEPCLNRGENVFYFREMRNNTIIQIRKFMKDSTS